MSFLSYPWRWQTITEHCLVLHFLIHDILMGFGCFVNGVKADDFEVTLSYHREIVVNDPTGSLEQIPPTSLSKI